MNKQVSDKNIKYAVFKVIVDDNIKPSMQNIKIFMSKVKEKYPTANEKNISDAVKMFYEMEFEGYAYTYAKLD